MSYNITSILDAVRADASTYYSDRVPSATTTSLTSIGNYITSESALSNEFLDKLVNRIAMTIVHNKVASNPLATLKKGGVPLGSDIQEIIANPAKAKTYDINSTDLLAIVKPDVKALYYRLNRKDKYPVTITREMLQTAFTSADAFSQTLDMIVSSIYSGDNLDEFILMKNLMVSAYNGNHIQKINIFDENDATLTDEIIAKSLVKGIKTYSKLFKFPSSKFNKYAETVGEGETPLITWTEQKDQIVILNATMAANIDVEVLAYAFNMDKTQIQTQTLEIDDFNGVPIAGILCDKSFFQVRDNLKEMRSFENGDNLTMKYILHHWQTYGYSLFANAIAFTYTPKTV
jgi:hypothetical protein